MTTALIEHSLVLGLGLNLEHSCIAYDNCIDWTFIGLGIWQNALPSSACHVQALGEESQGIEVKDWTFMHCLGQNWLILELDKMLCLAVPVMFKLGNKVKDWTLMGW